jgi:hypothetical protein
MSTAAQARAPRHYMAPPPAQPILPGPGLPQDRHARIAARRIFVDMKQRFMAAVEDLSGVRGDWLRYQVRQANEPVDLWLLRGVVFDALGHKDDYNRRTRDGLNSVLGTVFPDSGEILPFGQHW